MNDLALGMVLSFIFGGIIGSFLNVLILRLPQEQSIGGHSHCMHCNHQLHVFDLVPIFSYLFLVGKCRYCKTKISPRYIVIETITAILFAANYYFLLPGSNSGFISLFRLDFIAACLVVIFIVDFEHSLILDKVIYPATVILLLLSFNFGSGFVLNGLLSGFGVFLFFGALHYFSGGRWMGMGDVKFSFFLGLATPFPVIIITLFLSFMIGSFAGVFLLIAKIKKMSSAIPFGTFLALSCIIAIYFGEQLARWYFNFIGLRYL